MDGSNQYESDEVVLRRIARTLVALAVLCERAAFLPRPIRRLTLWIMRPTEARVRHFLVCWAEDLGVWGGYPESYFFNNGDGRADAVHMALRFEALAQLLNDLMRHEASIDWQGVASPFDHSAFRIGRFSETLHLLLEQRHTLPRRALPSPDT